MADLRAQHHNPMPWAVHPRALKRHDVIWLNCIGMAPPPGRSMDGDTIHLHIQCRPRDLAINLPVRMDGYDAPETRGKFADPVRGPAAEEALRRLAVGQHGVVKLYDGIDTLGRTPGRLWIWVGAAWLDVSQTMYDLGHIKDPAAPPPPFCEPPPAP